MHDRSRKVLIVSAAAIAFLVLGWATIIGIILAVGGVATVNLVERSDGVRLFLPVPMALVSATAATAGYLSPLEGDELIEVHGDLHLEEWEPFVDALFEVIEDSPDVTFVEVVDGADQVRVAKRGGKLQVEVRDPEISLRVAVPIRSARRTVTSLMR